MNEATAVKGLRLLRAHTSHSTPDPAPKAPTQTQSFKGDDGIKGSVGVERRDIS